LLLLLFLLYLFPRHIHLVNTSETHLWKSQMLILFDTWLRIFIQWCASTNDFCILIYDNGHFSILILLFGTAGLTVLQLWWSMRNQFLIMGQFPYYHFFVFMNNVQNQKTFWRRNWINLAMYFLVNYEQKLKIKNVHK
jgi:hypothetical protein